MTRKQTRRSVSIRGETHRKVSEYCESRSVSMSEFFERRVEEFFRRESDYEGTHVDVSKLRPIFRPETVPEQKAEPEADPQAAPKKSSKKSPKKSQPPHVPAAPAASDLPVSEPQPEPTPSVEPAPEPTLPSMGKRRYEEAERRKSLPREPSMGRPGGEKIPVARPEKNPLALGRSGFKSF
jgi:hypothetical protein